VFQILSILVSDPDGANPSTVTVNWGAETISIGGPIVTFEGAPNQSDAIRLLLDQDTSDGTTILSVQAASGPVVSYLPADATPAGVKVHHSLATYWSEGKTEAYLDALFALALD
jgi:hypothetical protein